MQISSFSKEDEYTAHCVQNGIRRDVNIYLLQDPKPSISDYVLVHVGYAIKIIETSDALERNALFQEMAQEVVEETKNA